MGLYGFEPFLVQTALWTGLTHKWGVRNFEVISTLSTKG
jgi:hypothetical protein